MNIKDFLILNTKASVGVAVDNDENDICVVKGL